VFYLFPFFTSLACGNLHFEKWPQLLQVGEIEQLAVTLLLTTRYPAEAVIPPRMRRRPAVLKNVFLFIMPKLTRPVFQTTGRVFVLFHPPVETGGYSNSTPSEFFS